MDKQVEDLRLSDSDEENSKSESSSGATTDELPDPGAAGTASWAEQVDEDDELDKLNKELPTETDTTEERRDWMRQLLKTLQLVSLRLHVQKGDVSRLGLTIAESVLALQPELEASLDDLMTMLTYCDDNKLEPKISRIPPPQALVKIEKLKVVSWDLGMLSYQYMGSRAKAIADLILKEELDVVFLQESNPMVNQYLLCRLYDKYSFSRGRKQNGQFQDVTLTLVRYATAVFLNRKIIYYTNTREHRTLLKVEIMVGNAKLCLLNTHLESMLGNSKFRMMQLQKCFDICGSLPSDFNVIFCGSLNIREWELAKMKIPKNLIDIWEIYGNPTNQFTWDLKINKLIQMPTGLTDEKGRPRPQPQKRFSRMYFRSSQQAFLRPMSFDLIGKEIVAANNYCASDHWALMSYFSVSKDCHIRRERSQSEPSNSNFSRSVDLLEGEDGKKKKEIIQEIVKDNWDDSD